MDDPTRPQRRPVAGQNAGLSGLHDGGFTSLLTINSVGLLRDFICVVIGIALIVGSIVVTMAMYTAVLEGTREIGILKALGASSGYILNLLFRETLLIAILGSVLGIVMTGGSEWLMMHAAPASLTQETVWRQAFRSLALCWEPSSPHGRRLSRTLSDH